MTSRSKNQPNKFDLAKKVRDIFSNRGLEIVALDHFVRLDRHNDPWDTGILNRKAYRRKRDVRIHNAVMKYLESRVDRATLDKNALPGDSPEECRNVIYVSEAIYVPDLKPVFSYRCGEKLNDANVEEAAKEIALQSRHISKAFSPQCVYITRAFRKEVEEQDNRILAITRSLWNCEMFLQLELKESELASTWGPCADADPELIRAADRDFLNSVRSISTQGYTTQENGVKEAYFVAGFDASSGAFHVANQIRQHNFWFLKIADLNLRGYTLVAPDIVKGGHTRVIRNGTFWTYKKGENGS